MVREMRRREVEQVMRQHQEYSEMRRRTELEKMREMSKRQIENIRRTMQNPNLEPPMRNRINEALEKYTFELEAFNRLVEVPMPQQPRQSQNAKIDEKNNPGDSNKVDNDEKKPLKDDPSLNDKKDKDEKTVPKPNLGPGDHPEPRITRVPKLCRVPNDDDSDIETVQTKTEPIGNVQL